MKKKIDKNNIKNKTQLKLVIISITAVVFIISTYAWFTGINKVFIEEFKVNIKASDGIVISLDAVDYASEINIGESEVTDDLTEYKSNTNSWIKNGRLRPTSTTGVINKDSSKLNLYQKVKLNTASGGYYLRTKKVNNNLYEGEGYIAFDLFIKNQSSDFYQNYNDNYIKGENEGIYLTYDSSVKLSDTGEGGEGIENSLRIAFIQIARVPLKETTSRVQDMSCKTSYSTSLCFQEKGVTWNIWEPNDVSHTVESINHFNKLCLKRIDIDNYGGECDTIKNGIYTNTYAINDEINLSDKVNIYDGLNDYMANDKLGLMDYFTDSEKIDKTNERKEIFYLAPNSITKTRIYIYLEGQDVDNFDLGKIDRKIIVNFGFTKDKYEVVSN